VTKPRRYVTPKPLCPDDDDDCEILGEWQKSNNMTCNLIHEVDLNLFLEKEGEGELEYLRLLADGYFRTVFAFINNGSGRVLKMLRLADYLEFKPKRYENHRQDAVINEVTGSSPYIVNIYGYCANSGLYDLSNGGDLKRNIKWLTRRRRRLPGEELLKIAHRIAASVADLHHTDALGRPSIAHTDIKPNQWIMIDGEYQLNDFNRAKLLTWSRKKNLTNPFYFDVNNGIVSLCNVLKRFCCFESAVHSSVLFGRPQWRSPEEHNFKSETEKIDIWSMGAVLYFVLTGKYPYSAYSSEDTEKFIKQRRPPRIPRYKRESKDFVDRAVVKAINMCMKGKPQDRATAREVANYLEWALRNAPQEVHNDTVEG
jgi:serine/threonine protein kinase